MVEFVDSRYVNSGNTNVASQSLLLPGSWGPGQLALMVVVANDASVTMTFESGWNIIDSGPVVTNSMKAAVAWRILEPDAIPPTVTLSAAFKLTTLLVLYGGVDATSPVIVGTRGQRPVNPPQTTTTVGPVTTTAADQLAISVFCEKASTSTVIADPAGTERRVASIGTGGGAVSALVVDEVVPTAGTTGTRTATWDVASSNGYGIMLAVKDGTSGGGNSIYQMSAGALTARSVYRMDTSVLT